MTVPEAETTAHPCDLPASWTIGDVFCCHVCGTWRSVVTFHDHETGLSWTGWDLMPEGATT